MRLINWTVTRDHPRSRGVYTRPAGAQTSAYGSSPLARGLRRAAGQRPDPQRIIPARAGFTGFLEAALNGEGDHPRSRGVYDLLAPAVSFLTGSSPLARGLPFAGGRLLRLHGIIPARAGFTGPGFVVFQYMKDHPRSRGVYQRRREESRAPQGSSPLARGLHQIQDSQMSTDRIIPARAGFTVWRPPTNSSSKDHPRSRGVYDQ